jgi:uncharacterized protein YndB with AHSA1/START domain
MTDAKPDQSQRSSSRTFETEVRIAAPKDAVWQAISTDTGLRRWFAPEAKTDSKVGGEIVWDWGLHHHWAQRIEILEPGARLRTRYDSAVDDGAGGKRPLFLDFILEGEGGITTLRLVQSGFGPEEGFDAEYDGISRGWPVELRSLRLYLEQHRGKDRRLAWSTRDLDMVPNQAWQILTGDGGLACGTQVDSLAEGAPFQVRTAYGDEFSGKALACHPREFSGDASSHGGAFFRFSIEEWGGSAHAWLWLGAYDHPADQVAALQERWDAMLERLFATGSEAAVQGGV